MLDLVATRAAVVVCVGDRSAVDAVVSLADGASAFRIAPDEAMLVGDPNVADGLTRTAAEAATPIDADAIVVDASDGWSGWTLEGKGAREALERLSQVPFPDTGFVQGDVAHVPARVVLAAPTQIHVFVPAMWREHLRERIVVDCAALGVRERAGERAWKASS